MKRTPCAAIACILMLCAVQGAVAQEGQDATTTCSDQLTYLSDQDPAYAYLEAEQRSIYASNPGLADPYSHAELRHPRAVHTFDELKRRAMESCANLAADQTCALDPQVLNELLQEIRCTPIPTRFESPIFALLIGRYVRQLDATRQAHYPQSSLTRFGSLPTGTFDAQALLPAGSTQPLVIMNRDIFFFTGPFSKALTDALPIEYEPDGGVRIEFAEERIRQRLSENPHIVRNFADAMARLASEGTTHGAREVTLDNRHNMLHGRLVSAMDLFFLSHEQAHVVLNHVSDSRAPLRLFGVAPVLAAGAAAVPQVANHPRLQVVTRTLEDEYMADAVGYALMLTTVASDDDPISLAVAGVAPELIFRLLDVAEQYGRQANGWSFASTGHPLPAERVRAIQVAAQALADSSPALQDNPFRDAYLAALDLLVAESDATIRQLLQLPPSQVAVTTESRPSPQ